MTIAVELYRRDPVHFTAAAVAKAAKVTPVTISQVFGGRAKLLESVKRAMGMPPEDPNNAPTMSYNGKGARPLQQPALPANQVRTTAKTEDDDPDDRKGLSRDFPEEGASMSVLLEWASTRGLAKALKCLDRGRLDVVPVIRDLSTAIANLAKVDKERNEDKPTTNANGETVVIRDYVPDNGRSDRARIVNIDKKLKSM